MGNVLVKEREIVVPGQILADGMDFLPSEGVIRDGEGLVATKIGLVGLSGRFVKLIPLAGFYLPKVDDLIIGRVTSVGMTNWRVDFGWVFDGVLSLKEASSDFIQRNADLNKYYTPGDCVLAKIVNVFGSRYIDLSMRGPGLRKLGPARLINVSPCKVPRVIGKQGSMISLIKEHTGCKIFVGQNGVIWLSGEEPGKELKAIDAIKLIEEKSHIAGLTDRVKEFLEKGK